MAQMIEFHDKRGVVNSYWPKLLQPFYAEDCISATYRKQMKGDLAGRVEYLDKVDCNQGQTHFTLIHEGGVEWIGR